MQNINEQCSHMIAYTKNTDLLSLSLALMHANVFPQYLSTINYDLAHSELTRREDGK